MEGSTEAAAALARVLELDPDGPLADDALVEQAVLLGVARWPEELGGIDAQQSARAKSLLEQATQIPGADRRNEAAFLKVLLELEPLPDQDAAGARVGLLQLSTGGDGAWQSRAIYTRAWFDEQHGRDEAARAAYQRLVIDSADPEVSTRAKVGAGRMTLRGGQAADAAVWFEQAIDEGGPAVAVQLRELAVRTRFAYTPGSGRSPEIVQASLGVRSFGGIVAFPDGGIALGDRRDGGVRRFAARGDLSAQWTVSGLQALCSTAVGSLYAAGSDAVYRLERGAAPRPVASLGAAGVVSEIAADDTGRIFLLDKKGGTLYRIDPGGAAPGPPMPLNGLRLTSLQFAADRLLAVDTKGGRVVSFTGQGAVETVADGFDKPQALARDAAGTLAVLMAAGGEIQFVDGSGRRLSTWAGQSAGISKAAGASFSADGLLHLFDAANDTWIRLR